MFADPVRLCVGPNNAAEMQGKIVVAERSDCFYEQKVCLGLYIPLLLFFLCLFVTYLVIFTFLGTRFLVFS